MTPDQIISAILNAMRAQTPGQKAPFMKVKLNDGTTFDGVPISFQSAIGVNYREAATFLQQNGQTRTVAIPDIASV